MNFKTLYKEKVTKSLMQDLHLGNVMAVPKIQKMYASHQMLKKRAMSSA